MNEQGYKREHLREYTGILTSGISNSRFKMELKVKDNPVLERSVEKIESSIELEFYYGWDTSTSFFHALFSCPKHYKNEQCDECDNVRDKHRQAENNLQRLQVGDTFRIMAALFKDRRSTLPPEVIDFKNYQPLLVACDEDSLRLPDTIEGVNKKREYFREKKREEKKHKRENTKRAVQTFFKGLLTKFSPYIDNWLVKGVIVTVIGGVIVGAILLVFGDSIKNFILAIIQDSG